MIHRLPLLVLLLGVTAACAEPAELPTIEIKTLQQKLATGQAPLTVVNFWATWCLPCREEFPEFVRFHRAHRQDGVRVLFVSADFDESAKDAAKFVRQQGVDWPSYRIVGNNQQIIEAMDPQWQGNLPATFVYDAKGKRLGAWHRKMSYEELEKLILPLLSADKPGEAAEKAPKTPEGEDPT